MNNEEPKLPILFSFCKPVKIVDRFILTRSDLRMFAVGLVSTKAQKKNKRWKEREEERREQQKKRHREVESNRKRYRETV